jgi:glycosyltransferase involved in cell wall biosynthesis
MELIRRDHEVTVFTHRRQHTVEQPPDFKLIAELRQRQSFDWQLLQKCDVDVWHVMNASYAWVALKAPNVVISVHGNDFINPYFLPMAPSWTGIPGLWRFESCLGSMRGRLWRKSSRRQMSRGLAAARQVIANSQYTKNFLVKLVPRCAANSSVGYVGVGQDYLGVQHRCHDANDAKRLVTVCRLVEPRKNVDKVLRALAQLKRYPFEFTVVGDGTLRLNLESLCRQLDLQNRVKFTGFVSKIEIQNLLATSDLFILTSEVLPNSIEGFGIAYLEANACGTPVLAARSAGAAEAVDEGKSGYFVEEPSIAAITAALDRFLKGEITFDGGDCKAFANRFTWARVVDHIYPYYPDRSGRWMAQHSIGSPG